MEILAFVNDYSDPGQVLELDGDPAVREPDVHMASVRPLNQVPDLLPDLYRWVVLLDLPGKGVLEVGLRVKTGLRRLSTSMTTLMSISCRVVIRLALPCAFLYSNTGGIQRERRL
jgi:hypothetical protein